MGRYTLFSEARLIKVGGRWIRFGILTSSRKSNCIDHRQASLITFLQAILLGGGRGTSGYFQRKLVTGPADQQNQNSERGVYVKKKKERQKEEKMSDRLVDGK